MKCDGMEVWCRRCTGKIGCDIYSRGVIIKRGCVKGLLVCLPQGVGEIIGRCDGGRDMMWGGVANDYPLTPTIIWIEQYVMFR